MLKLVRVLVGAATLCSVTPAIFAQDQRPAGLEKPKKEDLFFSGNVTGLTPDQVTVSRRTLTLTTITKTFARDANTIVEGKLQMKARVTVKFEKTEAGERALRVVVR